ncbi:MAG: hypothetical protein CJBNEKGG_03769 [Prosthecobacter sp.]|nr:hypothetical protein [Prosthecobacter sp.]
METAAAPDLIPSIWQRLGSGINAIGRKRPLLVLALAAVAGILVADHPRTATGFLACTLAVAAVMLALRRQRPAACCLLTTLFFMVHHAGQVRQTRQNPVRQHLLDHQGEEVFAELRGTLHPFQSGTSLDPTRALCSVQEVRWSQAAGWQPVTAGVQVFLPRGFALKQAGTYELSGRLALPRQAMNPGEFDDVAHGLRNGWVAVLMADEARLRQAQHWAPGFHLQRLAESSRQWMSQAIALGMEDRPEELSVLLAMALGASGQAGEEIEDAFRNSGTLHVFAVSGLHVVMLAGVASLALQCLGAGRSRSIPAILVIVFAYAFITGWRPSAARAAFMIAIVLAGIRWNRRGELQNSLGLAALVLLAMDTQQLFQPGFQLSFGVLWAIAALATPLMQKLRGWTELDPFLPPSLASFPAILTRWFRRQAAGLSCTSAAAWIGSLPLTFGHFRTLAPVAVLANMIVVPLSGLNLGLSCLSLLAAAFGLSTLQTGANLLNSWLAAAMMSSAAWFASLPGSSFTLDLRLEKPAPACLRLFQLPNGGSAAHLKVRDEHWLIDCGNERAWRRIVEPGLRQEGVNQLRGIILTHADSAHAGSAHLAFQRGGPRLHTSVLEPWRRDSSRSSLRALAREVPVDSLHWHRHQAGGQIKLDATARIEVLHPMPHDILDKGDDRALVLLLHLHGLRILMLSDAGHATFTRLLQRHPGLRCDILVRGQHRSDHDGLDELLRVTKPRAVISTSDSRFIEERLPDSLRQDCATLGIPLINLETAGCTRIDLADSGARLSFFHEPGEIVLPRRP